MRSLRALRLYSVLTVALTWPFAQNLRVVDPGDSAREVLAPRPLRRTERASWDRIGHWIRPETSLEKSAFRRSHSVISQMLAHERTSAAIDTGGTGEVSRGVPR